MVSTTKLHPNDSLPLTCSRTGTCCHGKNVWINPWELSLLAEAKGITPREFRDLFTDFGGIRLKFNGVKGWKDFEACSQYIPDFGCSVHTGRPLACRLYPLGRKKQGDSVDYIYQGTEFPCLEGCPEVVDLPKLTVEEYITDQSAECAQDGQDAFLELMQDLADGAFALLLDSGLAETGDRKTLQLWQKMGSEDPKDLTNRLGEEWIDRLTIPEINDFNEDPIAYSKAHYNLLQDCAQKSFGTLDSVEAFRDASVLMMGLALHLGRGLGADVPELAKHWINIAKENGALI